MNISVIGLGYIGLPTSIVLAKAGHHVFGYDKNQSIVEMLNSGNLHFQEEHLQEALDDAIASGRFQAYNEIVKADAYIIAVPTPFKSNDDEKLADLSYIDDATDCIASVLKKGDLVILESTSPPKTTKRMTNRLCEKTGLDRREFHSVHCPERVLPGRILFELENNDRIVGSERIESALIAKDLYSSFVIKGEIHITDDVTAEMAKLVENAYRDVNIAFANELSILCYDLNIDVHNLIHFANKHPRVDILSPGVGVGGHCISVDPWFIVQEASNANLIKTARTVNEAKPCWIADRIEEIIDHDRTKAIGILGLAYKPNVDDLRESPSITLINQLKSKGYKVFACEPNTTESCLNNIAILSLDEIMQSSDLVYIAQNHTEFNNIQSHPHACKIVQL